MIGTVARLTAVVALALVASGGSRGAVARRTGARVAAPSLVVLSAGGRSAPIFVSEREFAGVVRVAHDLADDIGRVTGSAGTVRTGTPAGASTVIVVGTIGHNETIDRLIADGKLDVRGVTGKWESSVTQTVERPWPGVARALVIAGSDKRGTIYGAYDVSASIGVSPWYWWGDVPVAHKDTVAVEAARVVRSEPAVRYRGIFINDEAPAFSGWTREKFGGVNHLVYTKIFELILRLHGNYLWPAMWGNAFADDDSLNAKLADDYGIVMGTSHHEPLTRAQQEWKRYGRGEWNYEHNDSTLRAFWRAGIERMGARENIVTVGMRGDGDMPMSEGSNIALLERIVNDQRKIITDVTHKPASQTPQLWALYKEVQDYYDRGMRVPDDITLLFSDDNWGNIRRLPSLAERNRPGGSGVYYHFDYVGGPRNYKWLNTNPIARVWEQLRLAHEYGANRIWIVNVGDLKPMEYPIQFFMDYAWNPDAITADKLPAYATAWAQQQFGPAHAVDIADVLSRYLMYSSRRKPELLDADTYSLTNFGEAERVVAEWDSLVSRARALSTSLPPAYHDAFYELVQHGIEAAANVNALYVTVAKNRQYAAQGRAATNALADRARALFERDAEISRTYNVQLAGGKWSHMMDQTHIGYTYWQEPPRNTMPRVDVIQLPASGDMGVAVVEQNRPAPPNGGRGGPPPGFVPPGARDAVLPPFDAYARQTYHVDVYNKGQTPFAFTATSSVPYLVVTPARGTVSDEARLSVAVDWSRAPARGAKAQITIVGANGARVAVDASVLPPLALGRDSVVGHVQSESFVSIEAEHVTRAVADAATKPGASATRWEVIPGLGRTLSAITRVPVTGPSLSATNSAPHLEYTVVTRDSGAVRVGTYVSPTQNFAASPNGLRYAVAFDDDAPQVVNITADTTNLTWEHGVGDNIRVLMTRHTLAHAGSHTLKFWSIDPGVVLQKFVVDFGGLPASYLGPLESFHRVAPPTGANSRGRR